MIRSLLTVALLTLLVVSSGGRSFAQQRDRDERVPPTHADVKYGPHERNVFDLWLPEGKAGPLPVFVYFHGGGFVAGDKQSFDPSPFLEAGMAVVSGNYRFVDGEKTLSPAPLLDAARVIQHLRSRAREWKLDEERIAVSGSSAGAVISMWIGYHNDLADPASEDRVARQSTRVRCIAPLDGPTNLDPKWINSNMGGPPHVHTSFSKLFGAPVEECERPDVQALVDEASPIEHLTADDPPTLLIYGGKLKGIPLPESASQGVLIHHPYFGKVLKARLDDLGIANELHVGVDGSKHHEIVVAWLQEQFKE